MRSKLPVDLIGWHLCRGEAVLNEQDIAETLALDNELARFTIECNSRARQAYLEQTGEDGISLPDPVAMAIALDRRVGTSWSKHYVEVETSSELTRGMSVVDRLNVAGDAHNKDLWTPLLKQGKPVDICWTLDVPRWKAALRKALTER